MDEKDREQKETETPAEEQYDAAWAEIEATEGKDTESTEETGLSGKDPEDKEEGADTIPVPKESEALKKESEEDPRDKALKDTKAWATKLSQENAELKRLITEGATKKEIEAQEQRTHEAKASLSPEKLANVFKEYPEFEDVLNPLMETVNDLKAKTAFYEQEKAQSVQNEEARRKQEALSSFETKVKPEVLKEHPDFDQIIANEQYFAWAEKQRPALQTAALNSNDPTDIKWALSEYKKANAMPEAAKVKQQEEEKRKQKLQNSMSLRGGATPFSTKAKADDSDYDSAWDEAEREERKKR